MPDYHLHEVKRDGSIAKRSVVLKCRDDDEAIRQAWQLREGRGVEVWQEGRLVADDPLKLGLVASLARPGGNATGVNFFGIAEPLSALADLLCGDFGRGR
jgi:hypothetical protein